MENENTAINELMDYSNFWASIIDTTVEAENKGNVVYFVMKGHPDIWVSNSQDRYTLNKLHTVRIKKGEKEFLRDWQENRDFNSLKELENLELEFIKDCVKKLR